MVVRFQIFESATKSWQDLCNEAAEFATGIGKHMLINISVTAVGGADLLGAGATGIITVWYWSSH